MERTAQAVTVRRRTGKFSLASITVVRVFVGVLVAFIAIIASLSVLRGPSGGSWFSLPIFTSERPLTGPELAERGQSAGRVASGVVSHKSQYQEAMRLFAAGDRKAAQTILEEILQDPALSATDRSFFQQQRELCLGSASSSVSPVASNNPTTVSRNRGGSSDCGPRALLLAARSISPTATLTLDRLTEIAGTGSEGTSLSGLKQAAQALKIQAEGVQMDYDALAQLRDPAVAWVDGNHFVAVLKVRRSLTGEVTATIHDPNQNAPEEIPALTLLQRSGGVLLLLKPLASTARPTVPNDSPKTSGTDGVSHEG